MKTLALLTLFAFYTLLSAQTELQTMLVFESPTDGTYSGGFNEFISGNGDINGDGFNDIVIPGHPIGEDEDERRIYIYFGSAKPDSIPDIILDVPTVDPGDMDTFGRVIAYDGDLNGDGYDDLVVAAPKYDGHYPNAGIVFIYWGGETLSEEPDVTLDALDYGDDCWGLKFGSDIDTSGDLNGDGFDDLVIGSPGPSLYWNGQADVFFGGDPFDMNVDWHVQGEMGEQFGDNVAVGDINGDGYDDLAVSQYILDSSSMQFHIYLGGQEVDQIADYTSVDLQASNFGYMFMNGDLNDDGMCDLVINRYIPSASIDILPGSVDLSATLTTYSVPNGEIGVGRCFYGFEEGESVLAYSITWDASFYLVELLDSLSIVHTFSGANLYQMFGGLLYCIGKYNEDDHGDYIISTKETEDSPWILHVFTTEYVSIDDEPSAPPSLTLSCFPNPVRSGATIRFSLAQAGPVEAAVYNIRGQRVATLANEPLAAGEHMLRWDTANTPNGIYLVNITHASGVTTSKFVLLK